MAKKARADEQTGEIVRAIAARGLLRPGTLTKAEIRAVCASALTQSPPKKGKR